MADISMDLYLAYEDGYKKGKAETESYLLHCGDVTPVTNADRIRAMTDEELAKYMLGTQESNGCPNHGMINCQDSCADCWLEWLRSEADG